MSNESRNTRMISFRVDADEYEKFRQLCYEQGTGNISEMARAGLKLILSQPSIAYTESLDRRVTELEARFRLIFRELKKLNSSSVLVPLANAASETKP